MSNHNWKEMKTLMWVQIVLLALIVLTGCSTTTTRHVWTEQECRRAGGILWCEGNWGRCECVDEEATREQMRRMGGPIL